MVLTYGYFIVPLLNTLKISEFLYGGNQKINSVNLVVDDEKVKTAPVISTSFNELVWDLKNMWQNCTD
jgi:hypothetical protein